MSLLPVRIAGTGSFLPGPPVPGDRVEAVLGPLDKAPPKIRSFVENLGQKMLERGGVRTRHFAVDPETGDMTYNFSSLAEKAARNALQMAGMEPQQIDLIIISCPSYDQSTPPTSALLQERPSLSVTPSISTRRSTIPCRSSPWPSSAERASKTC